jgi:hypothetical protein
MAKQEGRSIMPAMAARWSENATNPKNRKNHHFPSLKMRRLKYSSSHLSKAFKLLIYKGLRESNPATAPPNHAKNG